MLTVLVGTDKHARGERLAALLFPYVKGGADIRAYSDVSFDPDELRGIAGSQSLFGEKIVVTITGLSDTTELREEFEKIIPILAESTHRFILSENALVAAFVKKAQAHDATVEEFKEKDKPKKAEVFNTFALTDAFADRNRAQAWAFYRKAIDLGLEPRELHGKIFWIVKSMLVASTAKSAGESGLNPFVYQKAKRSSQNFAPGELERFTVELAEMFHDALVSGINIETALEAFILRSLAK